ncbi:thiolase-like protein [Clohesyomyces aquaticus]|uniref:Thiolase-like protein n=1 Tax=Clohesyomyces aquaticus TaxID=1231657 RepID=A0A1Y1ZHS6_9PLEO|nr:thiolase-like protein [Clohesyomyces aquaticus]
MDPSQRKMLEVSYEAFENAGEPWERFSGPRTGVFIGNMTSDHSVMQAYDADFSLPYASTGGSNSILSNRINHTFNLRGPRIQILTAKLGALSATSTCHTFDVSADGYGRAEGFGALYLKRYSDAKVGGYPIRAIVRGTAVNSNGRTAGISHPSADRQEALIRQAYKNAGLTTHDTTYFECHGTGTPVGDPLEMSAIRLMLTEIQVKTNLGHAGAASGIAGIIKTVLALESGMIPASIGIQSLNPLINFDDAQAKVLTELTPWPPERPRRASVNSFGYGGANGHSGKLFRTG